MRLVQRVSALLSRRAIDHALIGAAALAAHGVARATVDVDLLATDPGCLDERLWEELRSEGVAVEVRRGDETDPLLGVVRIVSKGHPPVDLIAGRPAWQRALLDRARPLRIGGSMVPVVEPADLVLLKLYAGGPQDAWDIDQLLDVNPAVAAEVEAWLPSLPEECARLWRRIVEARQTPPR